MKDTVSTVVPSRENWEQFCEVPDLTHAEWILWRKLSALARQDNRFFEICVAAVPLPSVTAVTLDWSDLVVRVENRWRYMRAHFPLYERYISFTFEPRDYIKHMPYDLTDQFAGRRHICPLCRQKVWSCFGHADKHWQAHRTDKSTKGRR